MAATEPIMTIKLDEFLPTKADGEVVTAADWNKLVAVFQTLNQNARALLDVRKVAETNEANIATIALGAIPDGSIGASKLEKSGTVKSMYRITEATTPVAGVTYYVLENNKYTPIQNLSEFDTGTVYYELITVPTEPAINDAAMFADQIITGDKLKDSTLFAGLCIDTFLGGLLSDKLTFYTDKGVKGRITDNNVLTFDITFPKAHKALVLFQSRCLFIITASKAVPNIVIGNTFNNAPPFYIKTIVGDEKQTSNVQGRSSARYNNDLFEQYDMGDNPYGAAGSRCVQLLQCYLTTTDESSTLHFAIQRTHDKDKYSGGGIYWGYSFGHCILGL